METGGVNEAAVRWDLICDLRDGVEIQLRGASPSARVTAGAQLLRRAGPGAMDSDSRRLTIRIAVQ